MMRLLTEDARLVCLHRKGKLDVEPTQDLLTIEGRRVLLEPDPEGRKISGCPMYGALIKPCRLTLAVKEGYSPLLHVEGRRVCLDTVRGLTDGTPPGTVFYEVETPGQQLVEELG
jgi:hypothetical protein